MHTAVPFQRIYLQFFCSGTPTWRLRRQMKYLYAFTKSRLTGFKTILITFLSETTYQYEKEKITNA